MTKISRRAALLGLGGAGLAGIGAVGFGLSRSSKAPAATPDPAPDDTVADRISGPHARSPAPPRRSTPGPAGHSPVCS